MRHIIMLSTMNLLFVIILLFFLYLLIEYDNRKEHLTLVKDCKYRNESCLIACQKSNDIIDELCFYKCIEYSSYC